VNTRSIASVGLAVALVASACAGSDDGETGGSTTVVQFHFTGEPEEAAVYDLLIEAFENQHPDIDVRPTAYGSKDDLLQHLVTSFAGGSAPDVFLLNYREYAQFVTRGALEPIGPRLEDESVARERQAASAESVGVSLDEYYDPPFEAFTLDGELQCLPQNISSLVVYWNRVLFERAGLEPPHAGWTWEEFRQAAIALTGGGNHGLGIGPSMARLAPFVWGAGGEIVDDADEPAHLTLDTPEARDALAFLVGLVRDDHVVPTETDLVAQDLESRFTAGRLGMFLSSRREVPAFREVAGLDWDVAPLPVGAQPATLLHSDGFCLARGGDHLDEATAFAAFAGGPLGQGILSQGGRTVPALRSVAESAAFLDPVSLPEGDQVFLDGIEFMRRTPVISTWPEIEDRIEETLTRAFYEPGYTIDDAIAGIDADTVPLFEEAADAR